MSALEQMPYDGGTRALVPPSAPATAFSGPERRSAVAQSRYRRAAPLRDNGGHLREAVSSGVRTLPHAQTSSYWWALLYVSSEHGSEHTRMACSNDLECILRDINFALRRATAAPSGAYADADAAPQQPTLPDGTIAVAGGPGWDLAMAIGRFSDKQSATTFCGLWAERCRGVISRFSKGETIARQMGLHAFGDYRIITRDPDAYRFITIVDQAAAPSQETPAIPVPTLQAKAPPRASTQRAVAI